MNVKKRIKQKNETKRFNKIFIAVVKPWSTTQFFKKTKKTTVKKKDRLNFENKQKC